LNLTVNPEVTSTTSITICDDLLPYSWNGLTFNGAGSQTATLTSSAGCDSLATLNLTVNPEVTSTDTQVACDSYMWIDGNTYTTSNNSATVVLSNAAGCDSTVTLDLTINTSYSTTDVQGNCDSYIWIDGNTYTTSNNTASFMLTSITGCDSLVTLDLTIANSLTGTDTQIACDSYTWIDGVTYTSSNNVASVLLAASGGCDSLVTLDLTINNSETATDIQSACDSYTWIDGNTYTASNNSATFVLTNASGCDSTVTLDLTITNSNTGTDTQTACDSYMWIDGNTYTSSNSSATFVLINSAGCDSTVTLDLTITNSNTGTDTQTACDTYTWIDGNTYTTSNNSATFVLINSAGCDSTVTLDLTITNSNTGTDTQTACDSYMWIDGNTYTASNNSATVVLTNVVGCDSTVTLDLTINNTPSFIVLGTDPSVCNASDGLVTISGLNASTSYTFIYDSLGISSQQINMTTDASGDYLLSGLSAGMYTNFSITLNGCEFTSTDMIDLNNPGAPSIDVQASTTECDTYTLAEITGANLSGNEGYYTQSNGGGTQLNSGDVISVTQTIYIYDILGSCSDESSFIISIDNTPSIINPGPQEVCESYFLPLSISGSNLSGNENYYTDLQSNGGEVITEAISSSQTVYIYDENGACSNEVSFEITINALPSLVSFTGEGIYCEGEAVNNLIAEVSGTADYSLEYTLDGNLLSLSSSNSSISLGNAPGIYILSSLNDNACGISLNETQVIVVNPTPNSPMLDGDATYCSNTSPESIQATGSTGSYTWYSDAFLNDLIGTNQSYTPDMFIGASTYYVTATENGCEGTPSEVTITFENCDILIPTAFTPDNDQVNDTWELGNIDDVYPNNIVSVYNRLGNKVYESDQGAYSGRPWGGDYNGDILPVASYYYVIEYNDGNSENINGIISIIK
ncbi:gliding motility-associated C-terminal domain-containing protein, partial [Crocinitomicaceae bacterium]|nr:gliding motility-associated C-terminal domain-containing protein [Crocinitomicaceae bacterium]